ncbi:MAG: leader peptidase (prepilin peptidase) / N-methyltransferase [Gammaproteobacteria bacterium]|nr:MAG: leader peptidase (prepilin peptidase) / N-methyltransferase [Gammaproteobacteria bacterium]TND03666.1 MAG: leader peptidase (prepilin peptidase) / N-methyltransferase [Gammaproteobacteria bacterium]
MDAIEYFRNNTWFFSVTSGMFGLLVGSFLNVVIYRLPLMMQREWRAQCAEAFGSSTLSDEISGVPSSPQEEPAFNLATPRSRCPQCGHPISAIENIPVLSYLVLRGRCKQCQTRISARYPTIELLTGLMFAVVAWHFGFSWAAGAVLLLTAGLICLTFIDIDHQLLPDNITLPLLWLGILVNLGGLFTDSASSIVGAVAGYGSLWLVYIVFKLVTGKEGMGFGDFKLLAALGAWLGWQALPVVIFLSAFVGAAIGIAMVVVRGRDRNIPIPFGPYLAAAGWIAMLWGDAITSGYFAFFSLTG